MTYGMPALRTCPVCGSQFAGGCHPCPGPPGTHDQETEMAYDPSADVADLINGLRQAALGGTDEVIRIRLSALLTGPYARLRGGLLLDHENDGRPVADAVREAFAALSRADGHQLSDEQIRRHGRDRYPTAGAQYRKLLDEAGELGEALIERAVTDSSGWRQQVRHEYADTGLALFALGRKLGIDLIAAMRELVGHDTRDFR
jgi:hypothetical protein